MVEQKKGVQYTVVKVKDYHGRPTKGVTEAALYNTENDVVDIINRSKVAIHVADPKKYQLNPEYKATTSCLESDEYDEAKGQDVAKRKMLYRYNTDKVRAINAALADLEVVEERLKRQRKIATERMKRDKKFLRRNCR